MSPAIRTMLINMEASKIGSIATSKNMIVEKNANTPITVSYTHLRAHET